MSKNLLIGIGGSGAKCVESVIHLCAAGLGPSSLNIGFVEPDEGNGNLKRTNQTLNEYIDARNAVRTKGSDNIDASPFLHTDIGRHSTGVWNPVPESVETIRDLFQYSMLSDESRLLFNSLFRDETAGKKHNEQEMELGVGFRGRPALGSAVMGATASSSDFWDAIESKTDQGGAEDPIRIFLFGSIFGGTGASGFPVVARLIRQILEQKQITGDAVKISGCLMLPYFYFPKPKESDQEVVATADQFLEMTQGAMEYYHHTIEKMTHNGQELFDNLYLAGWPHFYHLPVSEKGGSEQVNQPLPPELFAGLSALHFFAGSPRNDERILHIEVHEDKLTWDDIPDVARPNARHRPPFTSSKQALGWMTRFCYAYSQAYHPFLSPKEFKKYASQRWFQRFFSRNKIKLSDDGTKPKLTNINTYCRNFLRWFATTCSPPEGGYKNVHLIDTGLLTNTHEVDPKSSTGLHPLNVEYGSRTKSEFGRIVHDAEPVSLSDVMTYLTTAPIPDHTEGLGKFLSVLSKSLLVKEQAKQEAENG